MFVCVRNFIIHHLYDRLAKNDVLKVQHVSLCYHKSIELSNVLLNNFVTTVYQ